MEVSNGSIFMLKGMVRCVRDNGICKGEFSVDSCLYIVFSFCSKVYMRVYGVKICRNGMYVCVGKVEVKKNVTDFKRCS